jgi:hypothetical protein
LRHCANARFQEQAAQSLTLPGARLCTGGHFPAMRAAGLTAKTAALYAEMCAAIDNGLVAYEGNEIRKRGTETIAETVRCLIARA